MPVYLTKTLCFFILLSTSAFSAELETQLKKIPLFNSLSTTTENNEDAKKAGQALKQLWDQRNAPEDPNKEARLYYTSNVESKPCSHCPKYLNLTLEINKIVEKAKEDKDTALENDAFIQLSKLKFLYYVVRSESEQGGIECQQLGQQTLQPVKLDGNFKMIKETMVKMPEMTDFQYYPRGQEEVYYYYRGEGANANILIEVVMNKDGSANLRYYEFEASDGSTLYMKQLQREKKFAGKKDDKPKDNFFQPTLEVKTGDTLIPSDITLLKAGAKTQIAEDLNVKLDHQASVNEQSASFAFEKDNGQKWIVVEGKNITDGGKSLKTLVPVEIELMEESKLKINASLENTLSVNSIADAKKGNISATQTIKLGLTDHDNEYFNIKAEVDAEGLSKTTLQNKFSLGENSSIGSSVTMDRAGNKSFSVNNVTNVSTYGKLTTSFGVASDNKYFAETQFEKKISETTSLVVGSKIGRDDKSFTLMWQSKF